MAQLITWPRRWLHGAGSTGIWVKHFLLLPVFALALAPMVMGSLSGAEVAARVPSLRQTAFAAIGSSTSTLAIHWYPTSDGDGGPTLP